RERRRGRDVERPRSVAATESRVSDRARPSIGAALTGFFRRVLAPFRGALFIARHGLFGYMVLPLLLNAGVAGLSMALGLYWVRNKLAPDLAGASSWLASIGLFLL